jgi:hypothetical protein
LQSLGIAIPASWLVKKDKKKSLLSSGLLEIEVNGDEKSQLVAFVSRLGRDLFGWTESARLSAYLQR